MPLLLYFLEDTYYRESEQGIYIIYGQEGKECCFAVLRIPMYSTVVISGLEGKECTA